jgi:hypothetical protein
MNDFQEALRTFRPWSKIKVPTWTPELEVMQNLEEPAIDRGFGLNSSSLTRLEFEDHEIAFHGFGI